jgi:hypothetical protein
MNPRQLVSHIAQQNSKIVAIAALALGISATVLAPNVAFANRAEGTGPDLVSGNLLFRKLNAGESTTIPVVMKNNGGHTAGSNQLPPTLLIGLGPGLEPRGVVNADGTWLCTEFRQNAIGAHYATCYTSALDPGEAHQLGVKVRVTSAKGAWLSTYADPDNQIPEFDDDNNTSLSNLAQ